VFTGIVSDVGTIERLTDGDRVRRFEIACRYDPATIELGASIACAGVCLTVVDREPGPGGCRFAVEAAPEALTVTTLRDWAVGTLVNLERSLRLGDELGGHLVSGHVDGVARIVGRIDEGAATVFELEAPSGLARFVAVKGSVALDGTSLTVNTVTGDRFSCLLIPHSLAVTTWGARQIDDRVNLEVDQIARYVARLREAG
jgi:riboflavin synthase